MFQLVFIAVSALVWHLNRHYVSDFVDTFVKHDLVILGAPRVGKSTIAAQIEGPSSNPQVEKTTKPQKTKATRSVSMRKKVGLEITDLPGEPNKNIKKYKDDPESIRKLVEETTLWEKQIKSTTPKAIVYVFDDRLVQFPYENTNEQIELFKYFVNTLTCDKVRKAYGKKRINGIVLVFNKMDLWGPHRLNISLMALFEHIKPFLHDLYHYYGQNDGIKITHLGISALGNIYIQDVVDEFIRMEKK